MNIRQIFLFLSLSPFLMATDIIDHVFSLGTLFVLIALMIFFNSDIKSNHDKKTKQEDLKEEINYIDNQEIIVKTRYFDIRENLLYFFKTLNYDASRNNNTILANVVLEGENIRGETQAYYDFQGDPELLISSMNKLIQIFNTKLNNSVIFIKLNMYVIEHDDAKFNFTLNIHTTESEKFESILEDMAKENTKLYADMKMLEKSLKYIQGDNIKIDANNKSIGFNFTLPKCLDTYTMKTADYGEVHYPKLPVNIYIAHDNSLILDLLTNSIKKHNIGSINFLNLEKFIDFTHNAISQEKITNVFFVATSFLRSIESTHKVSLNKMQKEKHMKIFAVANNYSDVDYIKHRFPFVEIVMLPYTNEYFQVIVNKIFNKY